MAFGLTKKEFSWVLYDVGNSAFVMLSTALIPVYFASIAEDGSSVVVAWGYAETVASLILACCRDNCCDWCDEHTCQE